MSFIFIHGWRNDSSSASLQNGDLHRFTTFIDETATLFGTHPTLKRWGQDTITGVYIGWHGHTWCSWHVVHFWNRGKVATKIGNNTNLLVNIHTIVEQAAVHAGGIDDTLVGADCQWFVAGKLTIRCSQIKNCQI